MIRIVIKCFNMIKRFSMSFQRKLESRDLQTFAMSI